MLDICRSVQRSPNWNVTSEWIWSKWGTCLKTQKVLVKTLLLVRIRNLMNKVTHRRELFNCLRRYLYFTTFVFQKPSKQTFKFIFAKNWIGIDWPGFGTTSKCFQKGAYICQYFFLWKMLSKRGDLVKREFWLDLKD